MPAIDFPANPVEGQVFTTGGQRYIFTDGTWLSGYSGTEVGAALPPGGNTGDYLRKQSSVDGDGDWQAPEPEPEVIIVALSDETTAIASTGTKARFRMPFAMTVSEVRASLTTATATGIVTVDVNEAGVSILSTKLTIDATEKTSVSAATPAVISDASLADDAEITFDVDAIGDGTATGLKVALIGTRT